MPGSPDFSTRWFRLLVSASIGAVAGTYCLSRLRTLNEARSAADFTWQWLGARALLHGQNPYVVVTAGGPYDLIAPYIYPLPAAIVAIPFSAWLTPMYAAALFIGISSALLAWGLTAEGYHRLPIFASLPFVWAAGSGQFSPVLAASALIPAIGWIAPIKPTLGLATLAYRPRVEAIVGSAIFCGVGLIVNPHWMSEWITALGHRVDDVYWMPITVAGGPFLLLAVMRWKRPEARLLLVLSFMPQLFLFYDQLLLWLIPKTWKQSFALTLLSWVALGIGNARITRSLSTHDVVAAYAPCILVLLFLPSLAMVLVRRNESPVVPDKATPPPKAERRNPLSNLSSVKT